MKKPGAPDGAFSRSVLSEQTVADGPSADSPAADIASLRRGNLRATLISSLGSHCEVWRSNIRQQSAAGESVYCEFVIKFPRGEHSRAEIGLLARHYRMLKDALEDLVPEALFFITRINGSINVCVVARAVNIWFDMANPHNREEAVELLRAHPRPRNQLGRFLCAARHWRQSDRLIDLFGVNNLVMDTDRQIRYLDSFFVFFLEDMYDWPPEPDDPLPDRIALCIDRLDYLHRVFALAGGRV
jgi:hypothetical protein